MRVLFAVDSVFQLMVAVNLRLTSYKNDIADIIIYNSTVGAEQYCNNLRTTGAFEKCFFGKTSLTLVGDKYSFKEKLPKYSIYLKSLIMPEAVINNIDGNFKEIYDVFLFNGEGALPECIYNACKKRNKNLICYRFEDSYLSYTQEYGKIKGKARKIIERIAEIFGHKDINRDIKGYYFAEPNLVQYNFKYPVMQSVKFSRNNEELLRVLNTTFGFDLLTDDYQEKYIFFECGDAFFFKNNDDLRYVERLISVVGKKNVLIKRHPRIIENRFKKMGVHIAQGSTVPWELIQLNIPLAGKVFLTTKSAAALTSEVYFGDKCSALLLYRGIEGNQGEIGQNFEKYMCAFEKNSKNGFWRPNNIDEFTTIIKNIEDNNQ